MPTTLIVLSTYYLNDSVKAEINRIKLSGCSVVVSIGRGTWSGEQRSPPPNVPLVEFDTAVLPYVNKTVTARELWYNCEYHTLMAHKLFPTYDYYLYVEHDLRFTGEWADLISNINRSECDGLFLYLWTKMSKPRWPHWRDSPKNCKSYFASILALHRLSNNGADYLGRCYSMGRRGYSECSVPSLLADVGLQIGEFKDYGVNYDFMTCGWRARGSVDVNWSRIGWLYHPVRTVKKNI